MCYIFDGESLPKVTIIDTMKSSKDGLNIAENKYMKIKVCKNGNTHYWLSDETRNKLNLYGADPSRIGENIRIKTLDRF